MCVYIYTFLNHSIVKSWSFKNLKSIQKKAVHLSGINLTNGQKERGGGGNRNEEIKFYKIKDLEKLVKNLHLEKV